MQVNITARHLDLTSALSDYVRKKVEKCERYFDHLVWAQVILSVEKYRQVAEIIIHASKTTFRSKEQSVDLYAAIDLALDKIEKQIKKYKEKAKGHRKGKMTVNLPRAKRAQDNLVMPALTDTATGKPLITEVKRFDVKPTSVADAIGEMELMGYAFYMFLNAETSKINVIYHRDNGSYGLLEPDM